MLNESKNEKKKCCVETSETKVYGLGYTGNFVLWSFRLCEGDVGYCPASRFWTALVHTQKNIEWFSVNW